MNMYKWLEEIRMLDGILGTGCKMFHFGNAIDMRELMPKMPADLIAIGNIDHAGTFLNWSERSVYDETAALLKDCGKYPNFVLSSGCDIPPRTPWGDTTPSSAPQKTTIRIDRKTQNPPRKGGFFAPFIVLCQT